MHYVKYRPLTRAIFREHWTVPSVRGIKVHINQSLNRSWFISYIKHGTLHNARSRQCFTLHACRVFYLGTIIPWHLYNIRTLTTRYARRTGRVLVTIKTSICPTLARTAHGEMFCALLEILRTARCFAHCSRFCELREILRTARDFAYFARFCPLSEILPTSIFFAHFKKTFIF